MMKSKRQIEILNHINLKGSSYIDELIEVFKISKATLNRDLTLLEKSGYVKKIHGGVVSKKTMLTFEPLQLEKESVESEYKAMIAKEAVKYIKDGTIVILDSGSTSLCLAVEISQQRHFENLYIVTNDLKVAMALSDAEFVNLILLGGQKRKGLFSLVGSLTIQTLKNINADLFFLCVDAIDFERGISNANFDEIAIKDLMIKSAKQTIMIADYSKFNTWRLAKICDFNDIDVVITDKRIEKQDNERLHSLVNEVVVAR